MVLSAAAYLLEGFDVASSDLRQWVCLGMMGTLALAGLFSQLIMKDSKTARLLFTIAIGLISIQFAHLAGIIFDIYGSAADTSAFMAINAALSPQSIAAIAAVTLAASLAITFVGFQILARQQAARLMLSYIFINMLLLIPDRTTLTGIIAAVALVSASLAVFYFLFNRHSLYRTREGIAVQLLFLIAPAVALSRLAFYFGEFAGYNTMGLILAALLAKSAASWIPMRPIKEVAVLGAALLAIPCWHGLVTEVIALPVADLYYAARFAPAIAFLLLISEFSPGMGRVYRILSMMILALLTYLLCIGINSYISCTIAMFISVLVLMWGACKKYRDPAVCGAILSLFSLLMLVSQVLANLNSEMWVLLSLVGFSLVMMATVIERYGKKLQSAIPQSWEALSHWQ